MFIAALALLAAVTPPTDLGAEVDRIVKETLSSTGVPSISMAVVKDGKVVIARAYGDARLDPKTQAAPSMRYPIGSISKQFTATALLLLVDERKLSLDDRVSRFLPDVTRAGDIRVRDLLSHTAGIQDFYPQDYLPGFMTKEVKPEEMLDRWARRPLDFEPGTKWQYSNTGYFLAGLIVEKAAGMPLFEFLQQRIFGPLGMSVLDVDRGALGAQDAVGYTRYALGPPRPALREGKGWKFAAGGLAMSAQDLAKWDMALAGQKLLSPSSYAEMETAVRLKNGVGTEYGLGLGVAIEAGRRRLAHNGGVSGFATYNAVFPDDRAAIVVFTNDDGQGGAAAEGVAHRIVPLLFQSTDATSESRARSLLEGLAGGRIDRNVFSDNGNEYFSEVALKDFALSLKELGAPTKVEQTFQGERGGMTTRAFGITYKSKKLIAVERDLPDGRIEQFTVATD